MQVPSFTEHQVREAVAASSSYKQVLERIGLRAAGGNHATIRRYVELWSIPTDHFLPRRSHRGKVAIPLAEVLVRDSSYSRSALKQRLFDEALKKRECEMCGQPEEWRGKRMSLILDHANGEARDNRLENLRILCPNCNATLDTHCGKNKPRGRPPRECECCGGSFRVTHADQRFCSRACAAAVNAPLQRLVERPAIDVLLAEIAGAGYEAVSRRYGVSGNAIRKWLRSEGVDPPPGPGRDFNPPPTRHALTDAQARSALMLLGNGMTIRKVAARMGVGVTCIKDMRRGRTYRHLPRPAGLPPVSTPLTRRDSNVESARR